MKDITLQTFKPLVLDAPEPVLLHFHSAWCAPCAAMRPLLEEIDAEFPDVTVGMIDADQEAEINTLLHVSSVPVTFLFHKGKVLKNRAGFLKKETMTEWLRQLDTEVD